MLDFTACDEEYRKACDKYPIAEPDTAVVTRRWRMFLAIEVVIVMCLVGLFLFAKRAEFAAVVGVVLGTWLVFSLPVAVLYLLGKPPVMTIVPDWPSARSRAMTREVNNRAPLGNDEFYSRFYEGSAIPKETIARIRHYLQKRIDPIAERCVPADYLPLLWEDLDFADLFCGLGRDLGVELVASEGVFNGTLDGLIRIVHPRIESSLAVGKDARK